MKIYEKVLELLDIRVFGKEAGEVSQLFLGNKDGNERDAYRIGLGDISWYNEEMWGDGLGKLLINGAFDYKEEYCDYCEEWVNSFFSDIKVRLFMTSEMGYFKNVYNYLKSVRRKKDSSDKAFDIYFKEYRDLDLLCPLIFNVGGHIGNENISAKCSEYNSPINMLDNLEWVENENIPCTVDGDCCEDDVRRFFDRIRNDMDIIKVSKLFTDAGVVARKNIERLEDDVYKITFSNWNIWRNDEKEWVEKMGEIVYDYTYIRTDNLIVQGTYEELENMINLLHGGK